MAEKLFEDGQILTAEQLNTALESLSTRIGAHTHTGGANGPKLTGAALAADAVGEAHLQNQSVTESKLAVALLRSLKDGPTTTAVIRWAPVLGAGVLADTQALTAEATMATDTAKKVATAAVESAVVADGAKAVEGIKAVEATLIEGIFTPILINPIFAEWQFTGANVKAVTRRKSKGDSLSQPSAVRIEFTKAYKESNYVVSITPEWSNPPAYLIIFHRDKAYLDLTVPTGRYNDLIVSFHLTIFGELA